MLEKPAKAPKGDWKSLHLWQIQGVRDVLIGVAIVGLLWLGQKISIVTVPLLLAILLAYLFEPVIGWLMRRAGLKRHGAVGVVLVGALVVVVVPSVLGTTFGVIQTMDLVTDVSANLSKTSDAVATGRALQLKEAELDRVRKGAPGSPEQDPVEPAPAQAGDAAGEAAPDAAPAQPDAAVLEGEVSDLRRKFEAELDRAGKAGAAYRWIALALHRQTEGNTADDAFVTVRQWLRANADQIATVGAGAIRTTLGFIGSLFGVVLMCFLTAFFFYFLATGWVQFKGFTERLLPKKNRATIIHLATKFDGVISAFIRGRLTIAFIQAIVFTLGYLIIGVPAAFVLGPVVAILSIVPYLALVGVPISIVLLALETQTGFRSEWWWILFAPAVFYFIAQALDDYIWTPMIQGKGTGMDTPTILFASLAGGAIFGVFGLLIAIPIAACIKILIQEVFWPRFKAWSEGKERDFLPISRE